MRNQSDIDLIIEFSMKVSLITIKKISEALEVKLDLAILTFCLLDGENISINFFEKQDIISY